MPLARWTCGTAPPLVSHVGSEVSVSRPPCIRLQRQLGRRLFAPNRPLIDEPAQMAATMRDVMECRRVFSLGGGGERQVHTCSSAEEHFPGIFPDL